MARYKTNFEFDIPWVYKMAEELDIDRKLDLPYNYPDSLRDKIDKIYSDEAHRNSAFWLRRKELNGEKTHRNVLRDICSALYVNTIHINKYPNRYGANRENVRDSVSVSLWKSFTGREYQYRRKGQMIDGTSYRRTHVAYLAEPSLDLLEDMEKLIATGTLKTQREAPPRKENRSMAEEEIRGYEKMVENECVGVGEYGDRYDEFDAWTVQDYKSYVS